MIKKLISNFSTIVLIILICVIAYKIGQWRAYRPKESAKTVFITDTLDYSIPDYVEKPSLFFGILHTTIPPKTMRPVRYEEWMDSVFSAYSLIFSDGSVNIKGKRDRTSHEFTYDNVPPNVEIYGTETGFRVIRHRFENPFGWNGLVIGSEFYDLFNEINPYIETGIRIKNVNVNIGIDKYSIKEKIPCYVDVNYRVW